MNRSTLLLLTPLLLAGCVKQSASYYINGSEHALTVRAEQEYFWHDEVNLKLVAARLPECQRQFALATLPLDELDIELYAAGDNVFAMRAGKQAWRVETQTCTQLTEPTEAELGQRLGDFKLNADKKMVFEKAATSASALPAAAEKE